jgi:hypothetical protein
VLYFKIISTQAIKPKCAEFQNQLIVGQSAQTVLHFKTIFTWVKVPKMCILVSASHGPECPKCAEFQNQLIVGQSAQTVLHFKTIFMWVKVPKMCILVSASHGPECPKCAAFDVYHIHRIMYFLKSRVESLQS